MALLASEVWRVRFELGYHVLTVNAEPYISYVALFDQIIKPYLSDGATTTSSTSVTAPSTPPASFTLTLADATDFHTGDRVAIDVDDVQELATVESLSGSSVTVRLTYGHSGTYPVTVEGGEVIVRELLKKIRDVKAKMSTTFGSGMLKQVDEIGFYPSGQMTLFGSLGQELNYWRNELASALGIIQLWGRRAAASTSLSVY